MSSGRNGADLWHDSPRPAHGGGANIDAVNSFIETLVSTPWIYLAIALVVFVDAFFPPVPSESIVIAAAAASVALGQPQLAIVVACAAVGAIAGDNLTFAIGRAVGLERFEWMRRRRMRAALSAAGRGLDRRPAVFLMTARYVPVGRVAVNLVAGASGFRRRRFFLLSIVAGVTWAAYSVTIGLVAGHWLHGNALLGMLVGIAGGLVSGVIVDLVLRITARRFATGERSVSTADSATPTDAGSTMPESVGAE